MKYYRLLLLTSLLLLGCSNGPTPAQRELVDRLIQEQIDIPYQEPNWTNAAKEMLLKNGETAKEATARTKKQYTDIHNYLITLKSKPYKDKKVWAINMLEPTIELWEATLNASKQADKELILQLEQRKKWLAILKK